MPEGERGTIIRQVLEEQGLEWKRFRVYFLKDVFFARGARPTFLPMGEIASTERADECFPGFRALELAFTLGRGAYATMLVKCLSLGSAVVEEAQKDF
jgi:tRNA pseudouridine13 synthase